MKFRVLGRLPEDLARSEGPDSSISARFGRFWSDFGPQNGAKIVKNEVLEAPCFKGGSQVASRAPPGSILERFWDHFGTIFDNCSNIFLVIVACIL